jgi:hypothetical protein
MCCKFGEQCAAAILLLYLYSKTEVQHVSKHLVMMTMSVETCGASVMWKMISDKETRILGF